MKWSDRSGKSLHKLWSFVKESETILCRSSSFKNLFESTGNSLPVNVNPIFHHFSSHVMVSGQQFTNNCNHFQIKCSRRLPTPWITLTVTMSPFQEYKDSHVRHSFSSAKNFKYFVSLFSGFPDVETKLQLTHAPWEKRKPRPTFKAATDELNEL